MKSLLLVLALSLALPTLVEAQARRQVYRCGPDGREVRDSPCPSGEAASNPDGAPIDSKAARDRHLAEAKQAAAQAQARYAREAEARRQRNQAFGLQEQAASTPQPAAAKPRKAAASATP